MGSDDAARRGKAGWRGSRQLQAVLKLGYCLRVLLLEIRDCLVVTLLLFGQPRSINLSIIIFALSRKGKLPPDALHFVTLTFEKEIRDDKSADGDQAGESKSSPRQEDYITHSTPPTLH